MIDEQLILSGVNRKNEKAWKSLYEYYYAALCAYVNRILKGSESTEDLVQEVFIAIWKSDKKFDSVQDLTVICTGRVIITHWCSCGITRSMILF